MCRCTNTNSTNTFPVNNNINFNANCFMFAVTPNAHGEPSGPYRKPGRNPREISTHSARAGPHEHGGGGSQARPWPRGREDVPGVCQRDRSLLPRLGDGGRRRASGSCAKFLPLPSNTDTLRSSIIPQPLCRSPRSGPPHRTPATPPTLGKASGSG